MQNQVNRNAEMSITNGGGTQQFIIQGVPNMQGGVVNLADFIKSSSGTRLMKYCELLWLVTDCKYSHWTEKDAFY